MDLSCDGPQIYDSGPALTGIECGPLSQSDGSKGKLIRPSITVLRHGNKQGRLHVHKSQISVTAQHLAMFHRKTDGRTFVRNR